MILKFTEDCHECEAEMALEIGLLDDITNNIIEFPINHLEQQEWECPNCGLKHYTGDIQILSEKDLT
jgi:hypothetical protein